MPATPWRKDDHFRDNNGGSTVCVFNPLPAKARRITLATLALTPGRESIEVWQHTRSSKRLRHATPPRRHTACSLVVLPSKHLHVNDDASQAAAEASWRADGRRTRPLLSPGLNTTDADSGSSRTFPQMIPLDQLSAKIYDKFIYCLQILAFVARRTSPGPEVCCKLLLHIFFFPTSGGGGARRRGGGRRKGRWRR